MYMGYDEWVDCHGLMDGAIRMTAGPLMLGKNILRYFLNKDIDRLKTSYVAQSKLPDTQE
jgi:hypothetical protein